MFGAGAGSGAGGVATGGEWSPAPPSLHRRPRTTLAEEPDPSSRRHIVSGVPRCRCSRYAIRPAGAAEGDPMQVWTPRIVSLSALPSPGPRALLPPPPLPSPRVVFTCARCPQSDTAERHPGRRCGPGVACVGLSSDLPVLGVVCTLTLCS